RGAACPRCRPPPGGQVVGALAPPELRAFYAGSDVVVVPSIPTRDFLEPWGLVVNEAFHRGVPGGATAAGGGAGGGRRGGAGAASGRFARGWAPRAGGRWKPTPRRRGRAACSARCMRPRPA